MSNAYRFKCLILLLGMACFQAAGADNLALHSDITVIGSEVGQQLHGNIDINLASGAVNQQSNATALGAASDYAVVQSHVVQSIEITGNTTPDVAVARIEGQAFANTSGKLGINQAAGVGNAQANSTVFVFGAEAVADAELSQSVSGVISGSIADGLEYREATVASDAFHGARGLVQLNQAAGTANATSNSFALRVRLEGVQ